MPKEFAPVGKLMTFKNFYCQYGRFHYDKTNVIIHLINIPLILTSLFGLLRRVDSIRHVKIDSSGLAIGKWDPKTTKNLHDGVLVIWAILGATYTKVEAKIGACTWLAGYIGYRIIKTFGKLDEGSKKMFGGQFVKLLWLC